MSLSSQMSSEPSTFNAALYSVQFVVPYFGFAGTLMLSGYPGLSQAVEGQDLCNKATFVRKLP